MLSLRKCCLNFQSPIPLNNSYSGLVKKVNQFSRHQP